MKRFRFTLLVVENNDYQAEQVISAQAAANRLGIHLQVINTEHDPIVQAEQVLKLLQSGAGVRPDGILFEPVGTPLAQPAKVAASSGVGWVVLNREFVDYLPGLRQEYRTPMFSVTTSHTDVGRIQAEQIARLLPKGGAVLYIQGPSDNDASKRRSAGMQAAKPANIEVRALRGLWTEESAYHAVNQWLGLSIAQELVLGVVAAQNDAMALGARRAFHELAASATRDRWLNLPFIGCDGLPGTGQAAVRRGVLAATVVIPANAGHAIEVLVSSLQTGEQPPACILTEATSYPPLPSLKPVAT
jgi:ABC-type sugar transport system substrate-binding protein